jgi:hypothetical protein
VVITLLFILQEKGLGDENVYSLCGEFVMQSPPPSHKGPLIGKASLRLPYLALQDYDFAVEYCVHFLIFFEWASDNSKETPFLLLVIFQCKMIICRGTILKRILRKYSVELRTGLNYLRIVPNGGCVAEPLVLPTIYWIRTRHETRLE